MTSKQSQGRDNNNGNGQPIELQPIRADELYELSEMSPASYVVRFDFRRAGK
jgi:hypothetical protein